LIHGLKPYPAMKDSGVPWLGEVPGHWEKRSLGSLTSPISLRGRPDLPLLSVVREKGVIVRSVMNDDENHNFIPDDLSNYKVVHKGDLVINKMKAWQGSLGIAPSDGIVSPAYYVFDLAVGDLRYGEALLRSKPYVAFFGQASDGVRIGQWDLSIQRMKRIPVVLPPIVEQDSIVRFLDYMDRRIRKYIRVKQKLIALLNEQTQAIIHRAVTRGLNPDARLKPSGVEWLGDVPEHWEVRILGQIATSFRTGPFGSILHQSEYIDGGIPLVNPTHMNRGRIIEDSRCSVPHSVAGRLSNYILEKHDLVFSRRGELGRCALVRDREAGWVCGTGSIRVQIARGDIDPEYLIQALQVPWVGEYLSSFSVGATMDNLNTAILKGVPILLPPVREQKQILEDITKNSLNISRTIVNAEREISLLREYRTRLIADVVMGKYDVRAAAANLPDDAEEPEALAEAEDLPQAAEEAGEYDGLEEGVPDADEV
jgi:type I restriction enzyme S subunit